MLFLINEAVFDLSAAGLSLAGSAHRYRRLSLEFVQSLGAELFAEDPRLAANDPDRALRLAKMIAAVAPRVNAAQFLAPTRNCPPASVAVRFEAVPAAVIAALHAHQVAGTLTPWLADRQVWRRLAA
ncbi:MAG: hypothetical protein ACYC8V_15265 [Caulobacteraceae bacterium]